MAKRRDQTNRRAGPAHPSHGHRSDDERYLDNRYFGNATVPVLWLAQTWIESIAPFAEGSRPEPAELLDGLRGHALASIEFMRSRRSTFLRDARNDYGAYRRDLDAHWKTAFDLLELFVWGSVESLIGIEKRLETLGAAEQPLPRILTRVVGRSTRIAREIAWLLRGGYPEAALARWRTLHEVAVTATYMRLHGETAARRMLAHEVLKTLDFNERQRSLAGQEAMNDPDHTKEQRLRAAILDEFGAKFGNDYGWAADVTNRDKPTFEQIEDAAGMSAWRPAYKDATYPVHSTSRPIHDESLMRHGRDVVAPTGSGFATPAIMTIRSSMQANCSILALFVTTVEDVGGDIQSAIPLDALAREAMDAFASHEWPDWGLDHVPG